LRRRRGIEAQGRFPGLLGGLFATPIRSTGMAISYNVSVTLFGGLAPLTITWLTGLTASRFIPAYYLGAVALLSLILVGLFRPAPRPMAARQAA
jgi:MHS family proline/betaine transporter-like MFS transporter